MARKLRIQYPGAIYHVMNRGDHREAILGDDQDRQRFLATLEEGCQKTGWHVHGDCLMANVEEQRGAWHYGGELRESSEAKAERLIGEALRAQGAGPGQLRSWRKGHPFKLRLAAKLRAETTVTVAWIAARLSMGTRGHLSHLLYRDAHAGPDGSTEDQPTLGI